MDTGASGSESRYPNGRCCVFQPFDNGGAFDKRFDSIIDPALEAAGLEAYRVDRDHSATIPMDTLHEVIKSSTICLADFSTRNPNVMYEIGYAIAAGKHVILITDRNGEKFPFDLQYRTIVSYSTHSPQDFDDLKNQITSRARSILKQDDAAKKVAVAITTERTHGFTEYEVKALALICAMGDATEDSISAQAIKDRMAADAYINNLGTRLALSGLVSKRFIEQYRMDGENYGEGFWMYRLTERAENWMVENQELFNLTVDSKVPAKAPSSALSRNQTPNPFDHVIPDDDVPF